MLIGLVVPDSGSILVDGSSVQIPDPVVAASLGIGMVHQHFSLVEALTVWENVALGDEGRLSRTAVRSAVGDLSERYGLHVDPDARVADLPVGLRQRVEIIKCLRREPSILIFDEPTSALDPEMIKEVLDVMTSLAGEGRTMVCVTHEMGFAREAADRMLFMDQGQIIEDARPADFFAAPKSERARTFLEQILSH